MRYDYYAELSQGNRVRVEPLPAQRGLILDRNGQVLAENRPAFQLELVRERVPDVDATLQATHRDRRAARSTISTKHASW